MFSLVTNDIRHLSAAPSSVSHVSPLISDFSPPDASDQHVSDLQNATCPAPQLQVCFSSVCSLPAVLSPGRGPRVLRLHPWDSLRKFAGSRFSTPITGHTEGETSSDQSFIINFLKNYYKFNYRSHLPWKKWSKIKLSVLAAEGSRMEALATLGLSLGLFWHSGSYFENCDRILFAWLEAAIVVRSI